MTRYAIICAGRFKPGWAWLTLGDEAKAYVGKGLQGWLQDGNYRLGDWCWLLQWRNV